MKIATNCNISSIDVLIQGANIVRDAGRQEIAMAFFTEPGSSSTVTARGFEAYDQQQQSSSSVSYSTDTIQRANISAQEKGWVLNHTGHQHIEDNGHIHEPSSTDFNTMDSTIDQTKVQLVPLLYSRSDGSVDFKFYNNTHQNTDIIYNGKNYGDTISLTKDNQIQ